MNLEGGKYNVADTLQLDRSRLTQVVTLGNHRATTLLANPALSTHTARHLSLKIIESWTLRTPAQFHVQNDVRYEELYVVSCKAEKSSEQRAG
jgi:hypothetical protein